jgi:acid phosphatase (class A)
MNRRTWLKSLLFVGIVLTLGETTTLAKGDKTNLFFLQPKSYSFESILPDPPAPGSPEDQADLAQLKAIYSQASAQEKAAADAAANDSVFDFAQVLGPGFNPQALPKTAALFVEVTSDTKDAIKVAKNFYHRPRPNLDGKVADSDDDGKEGYAYPSGHTTRAYVWARLLAKLYPDKEQALLDLAAKKGHYRIVAGKHYPADVHAGQIYGEFLARQFLENSDFWHQWIKVKEETANKPGSDIKG